MACTTVSIIPEPSAVLAISAVAAASLAVAQAEPVISYVTPVEHSVLTVIPAEQPTMTVAPQPQATLSIGEVCSVSGGELHVLAASDGPLRTRDGGYFLLDPARETG